MKSLRCYLGIGISSVLLVSAVCVYWCLLRPLDGMITATYYQVHTTEDYRAGHTGKTSVEYLESFELMMILTALGTQDEGIINRSSDYFGNVVQYFSPWSEHPAVKQAGQLVLRQSLYPLGFFFPYQLDGDRAFPSPMYSKEISGIAMEAVDDFIQKTGYRDFYRMQDQYFQQSIDHFSSSVPLQEIKAWLEGHFSYSHQYYRVVISHLLNASQFTYLFRSTEENWSEIVMFVPPVSTHYDKLLKEGVIPEEMHRALASLLVFTEIDHNYVNPATDTFLNRLRISLTLSDREKFYSGRGYASPTLVFNEYLTWALYGLFCHDYFSPGTRDGIIAVLKDTMSRRGFIEFSGFMDGLLELYIQRKDGEVLEDMYRDIIKLL